VLGTGAPGLEFEMEKGATELPPRRELSGKRVKQRRGATAFRVRPVMQEEVENLPLNQVV